MKGKVKFSFIVALCLSASAACSGDYTVQRSTVINAPVNTIFEKVNNLKKNAEWSPWILEDPTLKITYNDIPAGVGASSRFVSKKEDYEGGITISESVENKKIVNELDFKERGKAKAVFLFEKEGSGVKVTWTMTGTGEGVMGKMFAPFMDSMVGPYYERGLAKLKEVSEKN